MRKIFIALVIAPTLLVVLAVAAILSVLNWPTVIINPHSLGMAARHIAPFGIYVTWDDASTSMVSHGFADETVKISFKNLCVEMKPEIEKVCFKDVELAGRYSFSDFVPKLVSLGPVKLDGGEAAIVVPEKENGKEPQGPLAFPEIVLPGIIKSSKFYQSEISFDRIEINSGEDSYLGRCGISVNTNEKDELSEIDVKGSFRDDKSGQSYDAKLVLSSAEGFKKDVWEAYASADASLGKGLSANVDAKLAASEHKKISHDINLKFKKDRINAAARLDGVLSERELITKIAGSVDNISDAVRGVKFPDCSLRLTSLKTRKNRADLHLTCPIDIFLKKIKLRKDLETVYEPPSRMRLNVTAKAKTPFKPDMNEKIEGDVSIRIEPLKSRLVRTRGDIKAKFSGIPSEPKEKWQLDADLDVDFIIDEFSRLVEAMSATKWPVPAPFNVLKGSMEFSLEGRISNASDFGQFPVKLTTRLHSPKQQIDIDSSGELSLVLSNNSSHAHEIELDVNLKDVQLQLPDVALAAIPRFTPDGRIILNPEKKRDQNGPSTSIDYKVHIETTEGRPIRILSNITPAFVPIYVNVDLENDEFSGEVKIANFPVKLFTRQAQLEKLIFDLKEPIESTLVEGRMSMSFPEMKIIVLMIGPIESPAITLESDPPMTQGDIISTLLYGQPLEGIDSDQASSVNNMNAAMSDRALALTSFFLLGSTPIQSIAYNPQSKVFAAQLRLGEKTSLTVGGSETDKYVKVGRRLGKGFRISTGVDKREDNDEAAATAMIEWSKRY